MLVIVMSHVNGNQEDNVYFRIQRDPSRLITFVRVVEMHVTLRAQAVDRFAPIHCNVCYKVFPTLPELMREMARREAQAGKPLECLDARARGFQITDHIPWCKNVDIGDRPAWVMDESWR